jgi:ribosomal protein L11 methyltransferase
VAEDWENRWRAFHRPVRVGPLWIGPPWEPPPGDAVPVVIDPGRAFGTGAHATTRLCLELLAETAGGSLVDLGCGSGVLAIAAAKLGFDPVTALDVDPAAVEATVANASRNSVAIDAQVADVVAGDLPVCDVAVANIERGAVEQLTRRVPCARLITSGYLAADAPSLGPFRRVRRVESDGWVAELAHRAEPS